MKTQTQIKLFKRKNNPLKLSPFKKDKFDISFLEQEPVKFLSPKNITGLDNSFYKKQESIFKSLQQEIVLLKKENQALKIQKFNIQEENIALRKIITQHNQEQKYRQIQQFSTQNVLNQLKEKIQLLSQDDQLSTYDQIDFGDICNCHKYEEELVNYKNKVKFLQDSLIHSQQIIIKIKEQNGKLKERLCLIQQKIKNKRSSTKTLSNKTLQKVKYHTTSLTRIGQQPFIEQEQ